MLILSVAFLLKKKLKYFAKEILFLNHSLLVIHDLKPTAPKAPESTDSMPSAGGRGREES